MLLRTQHLSKSVNFLLACILLIFTADLIGQPPGENDCDCSNLIITSEAHQGEECCEGSITVTPIGECCYTINSVSNGGVDYTLDNYCKALNYTYDNCEGLSTWEVVVNGEVCDCGTISCEESPPGIDPCEEETCDCNVVVYADDDPCLMRACVQGEDCTGPYDFKWTTPSGNIITNPLINNQYNCSWLRADETGDYCVSIVDADGCVSEDCVQMHCGCEPLYVLNDTIGTRLRVWCTNSNEVRVQATMKLDAECNECCQLVSEGEKSFSYTYSIQIINLTTNEEIVSIEKTSNGIDHCILSNTNHFSYKRTCDEVDEYDTLKLIWSIDFHTEGCGFDSNNIPISGTLEYYIPCGPLPCCRAEPCPPDF